MAKAGAKSEKQELVCPLCRFLSEVCEGLEAKSEFWGHFNNARIEFLEGIKGLIDSRIASLRKREKKVTKIEVS